MTTLAKNKKRSFLYEGNNALPVAASTKIYEGSAVGDNASGYVRPLQAGDPFRGFCDAIADNSSGSAGDIRADLTREGYVQLNVSGAAITDVGKAVYASDDDTFTLTKSTNTYIGRIVRFVSTGVVIVYFNAKRGGIAQVTELTDNSGGTAADTIAAIGGTYSQTEVGNAIASLAAKVNDLARQIK